MRTKSLALGICLLAGVTLGEDPLASFAKQSLGLDLASVSFGMPVPANGEYGIVAPPLSPPPLADAAEVSWMTNAASGKYSHDFTNRVLRYGFRDGRLAAVRISINSLSPGANGWDQEKVEQRRKELIRIQAELTKASRGQRSNPDDASFRIQYGAMCAPSPESLFLMEIQITPVEKKKAP
jgi:hypothetical protein